MESRQDSLVPVSDATVVLRGPTLDVAFRAAEQVATAILSDQRDHVAQTAVAVLVNGTYSCQFDLRRMAAPGVYAIGFRGALNAFRHLSDGTSTSPPVKSLASSSSAIVARSTFRQKDQTFYAAVFRDIASKALRLHLSLADDIDAHLESTASGERPPASYSIVACVYNVARYLDDFFVSLRDQTIGFNSRIELIVVDDGSTDTSAKIIERWRRKYPKRIRYFHKPNGGLSAARNFGLERASNDWVCFIDPDDFIDKYYFEKAEEIIQRHGDDISMIACNMLNYYEGLGRVENDHYLRFRFAGGSKLVPTRDLGRFIHFNVNCTFLRRSTLVREKLLFSTRIKPNFEDSYLLQRYLFLSQEEYVCFLAEAKYCYRKRADQSSLVQTAPRDPRWYGDQLQYGYLALLEECRDRFGEIPLHIQNLILCDLRRQLLAVVDRENDTGFLDDEQKNRFEQLLRAIYSHISDDVISGYDLSDFPSVLKAGILLCFKAAPGPYGRAEVDRLDERRGLVRVICWTGDSNPNCIATVDGEAETPKFHKAIRHEFLGRTFVWEHVFWLRYAGRGAVRVKLDERELAVVYRGDVELSGRIRRRPRLQDHGSSPNAPDLQRLARSKAVRSAFRDCWLCMDRIDRADDNAEHFYRYLLRQHPEKNAFFVLREDSPDWPRLLQQGFRLLNFGGVEHGLALLNARFLISSFADREIVEHPSTDHLGGLLNFEFVFLQHGVTKDDISAYLGDRAIARLVTATRPEFESFVGNGSPYRLSEKEVVLTGFPRHDALLSDVPTNSPPTILLMPTWRPTAVMRRGPNGKLIPSREFRTSQFARRWRQLLHSPRLRALADRSGCRVVFLLHPKLEGAADVFDVPANVDVRRFGTGTLCQDLLRDCSIFITDFSSFAFDAAYIGKPVIYYQVDRDSFFSNGPMLRQGYFDYVRDGFGPVCAEEAELLDAMEERLAAGTADPIHAERARRTFAFRDGKSCDRVFESIVSLGG